VSPELAALWGAGAATVCTGLGFAVGYAFGWVVRDTKAGIIEDRWIRAVSIAREERDEAKALIATLLAQEQCPEELQHSKSQDPEPSAS